MSKTNPVVKAARNLKACRLRIARRRTRGEDGQRTFRTFFATAPKPCYGLWEERAQ